MGERGVIRGNPAAGDRFVATGSQAFERVFTHHFQHGKPWLAIGREAVPHHTAIQQRRDAIHHIQARNHATCFHRFQSAAADKCAKLGEQLAFGGRHQAITPVNRRPQGLMAGGPIRVIAGKQRQPIVEPRNQGLGRHHLNSRRDEFNCQRQPIQPRTNNPHGGGILRVQCPIGQYRFGAAHKQRHRRIFAKRFPRCLKR